MSSKPPSCVANGEAASGSIDLNAETAERLDLDVAAGGSDPPASCSGDVECGSEPSGAAEASDGAAAHRGAEAAVEEAVRFPSSESDAACSRLLGELAGAAEEGPSSGVQNQGTDEDDVGENPTTNEPPLEASAVVAGVGTEAVDGSPGKSDQRGDQQAAGVSSDVPASVNTAVAIESVEERRSDSALPGTSDWSTCRLEVSSELEAGERVTSASHPGDRLGALPGGENISESGAAGSEAETSSTDGVINHETKEGQGEQQDGGDLAEENGTENIGQEDKVKEELLKKSENSAVKQATTRQEASLSETQQPSYYFPSDQKDDFSVSDLVWGKVKSHPWWPGQIIDPSYASELALKHQRKDNFLVAYFGDKTFAWCDESQLKSFTGLFSQMEKQSSSDAFSDAVNSALTEASRRVELGMICSCVPEELYHSLKIQKIENSGIQEGVDVLLTDKFFGLSSFRPDQFVEYIRALARLPTASVDGFDLAIAKAQLMAYYRSRGYRSLPEFFAGKGLLEGKRSTLPSEDMFEYSTPTPMDEEKLPALVSRKLRPNSGASSLHKNKSIAEDGKKKKSVSDLVESEEGSRLTSGTEIDLGKKYHSILAVPSDSKRTKRKRLDMLGDLEKKCPDPAPAPNESFKLGECVSRAASKLTNSPSILKSNNDVFSKGRAKADFGDDSPFSLDDSVLLAEETQNIEASISNGYASLGEMLSWLGLAAVDPLKEYDFLTTVISFFSGFLKFRDSDSEDLTDPSEQTGPKGGRRKSIPSPSSSEDIKPLVEVKPLYEVKRKRGRPRSNPTANMTSPEDAKHRRGRPKSNPAEKSMNTKGMNIPEEVKRKRGRPRSNPAEGVDPSEEYEHKRGRPESTFTENLHPPDGNKRKRGRPRSTSIKEDAEHLVQVQQSKQLISKTTSSDMSTPGYMKDMYWTDVVIQSSPEEKRRGWKRREESLMQSPTNTQIPANEPYKSQPLGMLLDIQKHNRVSSASPTRSPAFISERPIKYFGKKCIEESNPTVLVLNFMHSNSLPSETDLVRIFSPYGPLKESETEVQKKMNCAKVVFKRRADAEVAFSAAGKYSFFGPSLLSFRLRDFPLVSEKSPYITSEDKKVSPTNCSNSDVSSLKKDKALVNDCTMEVPEVILDETSLDSKTTEAFAGKNHDHMGGYQTETPGVEKGEMPMGSSEVHSTENNETETSCSNLEISGSEKLQASVDVCSGDTNGQKSVEVALELDFQGYNRDEITARDSDFLAVSSMEDPSLADACGMMAQDNRRVVPSVDCVNVKSPGIAEEVIPMKDENSEAFNSKGYQPAHSDSRGFEIEGIRSDETDGCNLNDLGNANVPVPTEVCDMDTQDQEGDEAPVTNAVLEVRDTKTDETEAGDLEVLGSGEDRAVTDVCNVILDENKREKSPIDGGNVEIQGIIKDGLLPNDEYLHVSDGKTDPISVDICHLKCPNINEVVVKTDSIECFAIEPNETMGQSGDLDVWNSVKEESTTSGPSYVEVEGQKKGESLDVLGVRNDEPKNAGGLVVDSCPEAVDSCSLEVQNAGGGNFSVDGSRLVVSGATKVDMVMDDDNLENAGISCTEDAAAVDSCSLNVQNARGGNFLVDSSSLVVPGASKVDAKKNDGNLEYPESKDDPTSTDIYISGVPVSKGDETAVGGHELKSETDRTQVCEEHVEASVGKLSNVHLGHGKADDIINLLNWEIPESRSDVNPMIGKLQGASPCRIVGVPVGGGTLGVSDIRVDKITDAANSEFLGGMQTSVCKTDDAPADAGTLKVPDGRVDEYSETTDLEVSVDRSDIAPKEHSVCKTENVSESREMVVLDTRTDTLTIAANLEMPDTRDDTKQVFDKHLKASGCEIDDTAQGGGKELLSGVGNEIIDADKPEIPDSGTDTPSKNLGDIDVPHLTGIED